MAPEAPAPETAHSPQARAIRATFGRTIPQRSNDLISHLIRLRRYHRSKTSCSCKSCRKRTAASLVMAWNVPNPSTLSLHLNLCQVALLPETLIFAVGSTFTSAGKTLHKSNSKQQAEMHITSTWSPKAFLHQFPHPTSPHHPDIPP